MIAIPVPDHSDRMATAVHESAHAVVARALGVEVASVSLHPASAERLGVCCTLLRDEPANLWAQSVMALAGGIAEQKFAGYSPNMLAVMGRSAWATDLVPHQTDPQTFRCDLQHHIRRSPCRRERQTIR
jgi:hypothetical protein